MPEYHMFSEDNSFMLSAQKKVTLTPGVTFQISSEVGPRAFPSRLAKLKSNFLKTEFSALEDGVLLQNGKELEIGSVIHEDHLWSEISDMLKGIPDEDIPYGRSTTVIIPSVDDSGASTAVPGAGRTLQQRFLGGDVDGLMIMYSMKPTWDHETKAFTLSFYGRATMAAMSNFQLVHNRHPEKTLLAFGKVEETVFTLDYRHPLSALQAFSIALSALA